MELAGCPIYLDFMSRQIYNLVMIKVSQLAICNTQRQAQTHYFVKVVFSRSKVIFCLGRRQM